MSSSPDSQDLIYDETFWVSCNNNLNESFSVTFIWEWSVSRSMLKSDTPLLHPNHKNNTDQNVINPIKKLIQLSPSVVIAMLILRSPLGIVDPLFYLN